MKRLLQRALGFLGYEIRRIPAANPAPASQPTPYRYKQDGLFTVHNCAFMQEPRFADAYAAAAKATGEDYHWHWRVHIALWSAAHALMVAGDFVECGVNRGFLSYAIMTYLNWNDHERRFYLLDTFQGMDRRYVSKEEADRGHLDANAKNLESGFYVSGGDSVQKTFSTWKRVSIVEGSVPDTLTQVDAPLISFLHIDMNCAPPEVAALKGLWRKISLGGIVLLDDYAYHGHDLQKAAMDALAAELGTQIVSLPTGQGLLIKAGDGRCPVSHS